MREVSAHSVSLHYGRLFAIHGVSVDFQAGTTTALLGDNGSGKTTLLSVLATVETPSSGRVTYDEVEQREFARRFRDRIGWLAHDSLVYEHLTGRENLRFYAEMYGNADPGSTADDWLEYVELTEAANRPVSEYSRGMRQRISIARAVIQDPDLLLFDEPMTGLDRSSRDLVFDSFERFRNEGKIVVFATHDLEAAGRLADRVAFLRNGRLHATASDVEAGEVVELYRQHA